MPAHPPSPPYVMKRYGVWRVIIPVRGKLSPRVAVPCFGSESEALVWLASDEGEASILQARTRQSGGQK